MNCTRACLKQDATKLKVRSIHAVCASFVITVEAATGPMVAAVVIPGALESSLKPSYGQHTIRIKLRFQQVRFAWVLPKSKGQAKDRHG